MSYETEKWYDAQYEAQFEIDPDYQQPECKSCNCLISEDTNETYKGYCKECYEN